MAEYISIKIDRQHLEEHVKSICRTNLQRRDVKICKTCPFLGPVMDIMIENDWKYRHEMDEYLAFYRKLYPK